ncbi:MAG: hypothetical protein U5O39_13335 [Gammaproteobacteria bacterium]|nr:hypothetical protein [Gammaproteobacteria bacterium]
MRRVRSGSTSTNSPALSRKYVRSQISIVLQEPFLYSASILANLRVGRIDASFDEVVAATKAACIP